MIRTLKFARMFSSFQQAKDYYRILGLKPNASSQEIKNAYKSLAKQYHPDINKGNEDKFKQINEAYQVLSDLSQKQKYDSFHSNTQKQSPSTDNHNSNRQQERYKGYDWENVSPRDRQIFQMLRRQQEQFERQYRQFQRQKERGGPRFHQQRYSAKDEDLRRYYESMKNGTYDYSERRSRRRPESHEFYNQKYDRSKDSLFGCIGQMAKSAWKVWMDLKSKK